MFRKMVDDMKVKKIKIVKYALFLPFCLNEVIDKNNLMNHGRNAFLLQLIIIFVGVWLYYGTISLFLLTMIFKCWSLKVYIYSGITYYFLIFVIIIKESGVMKWILKKLKKN